MRISRRTLAPLALAGTLLCTLAGAASAQAAFQIDLPAAGAYVNDTTPTVSFSGATALSSVTLNVDGIAVDAGSTGATDALGTGTITPTAPVTLGSRTEVVLSLDDSLLGRSGDVHVFVDQFPDISGTGDASTVDAGDVHFDVSSAIPGNDVELRDAGADAIVGNGDDVLLATAPAADPGRNVDDMTPDDPLDAGSHTLYAVTLDDNGRASSPSDAVTFDVAPAAPSYADLFTTARLNQSSPPIHIAGVDPTASKVTLYEVQDVGGVGTNVEVGSTTTVDAVHGTATVTPSSGFADGYHSLAIAQTVNSVESLTNGVSDALAQIQILTSAPVLETSFSGTLTNDNTPYFDASNTLTNGTDNRTFAYLYLDGQRAGQSDPMFSGGVSGMQADDPIAEGAHSAYVVTVDDLGHESAVHSNTVSFTVDTVGPAAPSVKSPADGSTTTTSLPVLTVTTEPGAIAHVVVDDVGEEIDQTADSSGNVTFTLTQALADGAHALHVFSRDAAGNYGDVTSTTFNVLTPKPPTPTPPPAATPPAPTKPPVTTDPDGDGIANGWTVGGKTAPAPGAPKASVTGGKVKLKLTAAPAGAKSIRVYRADGKGGYKLVKTLTAKSKTFTDSTVKAGHSYKYKTVGVNAKGQQGKASKTATAKIKKK